MTTKPTEVVVAVAFDKDGRFLMTSRPEGKVYAGYLEFPGGKVEAGESLEEACMVHGIDADALTVFINNYLAEKAAKAE